MYLLLSDLSWAKEAENNKQAVRMERMCFINNYLVIGNKNPANKIFVALKVNKEIITIKKGLKMNLFVGGHACI